jgi:hypothetical protein
MWGEGARVLGSGGHYVRTLAFARLGELPFFLLGCWVVWAWARRLGGEAAGAIALVFFAANPNVLAHASLATTDIAPTALVVTALFALARWLEEPNWQRSISLGVCGALAVVAKFSAVAFLAPSCVLAYGLWTRARGGASLQRARRGPRPLLAVGAVTSVGLVVVWAAYRFSIGPITLGSAVMVPAPKLFTGLGDFLAHGALGHSAFLLGQTSAHGWWYYFPIVLLVKTPLPLLVFGGVGAWLAARDTVRRSSWESSVPLIGCAVILAVAMATHVDIGVRHVLPLYPLLAIVAASGALHVWQRSTASARPAMAQAGRLGTPLALAATILIAVHAHPDHLAYFNLVAGPHPEQVLSDSNLDWGQDLYRLAGEVRSRGIDTLHLAYFGSADPAAAGVANARSLAPHQRATGWIAVSETYLAGIWSDTGYVWLRQYAPVARVGRSMRLYRLSPAPYATR